MTPNDALSWQELAAIIVMATFMMGLGAAIWRMADRISKGDADVEARSDIKHSKAAADLSAFREYVAREYVAKESLRELEDRLVAAIERLGDRLDRILEKTR